MKQSKNFDTTYGEHLVGVSFNPGGNPTVDMIKARAAHLIDYIRDNGEDRRTQNLAIDAIEEGAMWAVKSVTKQKRT